MSRCRGGPRYAIRNALRYVAEVELGISDRKHVVSHSTNLIGDGREGPVEKGFRFRNDAGGTVGGSVVQARDIAEVHVHGSVAVLPIPRQLPPAPGRFVNRLREIENVDQLVAGPHSTGATPVVVLTGGHGVGKTATGRHWAHDNAGRFTDGQLYADFGALRVRAGADIADVLGGFLRALGIPDEVMPAGLEERTALFRSRTATLRVLVVLDDVDHPAQVQPLVPSGPGSAVVVTSRELLEELVIDDAGIVPLRALDLESSRVLLANTIDEQRVRADPEAVERLAEFCAGLPIALQVCGARLLSHPQRPVSWLVAKLADADQRLDRIAVTAQRSLQVVFDDAYHALDADVARTYRRLGLHPGPSFTAAVASAASGFPVDQVAGLLDRLVEAHLLEDDIDRFRFHDLVRIHARNAAKHEEGTDDRADVLHRIVGSYVNAAKRMDYAMIPSRLRFTNAPAEAEPGEPVPRSPAEALSWFEAERHNLFAALREASDREWDADVWHLGEALWPAYDNHKHYEEAREVYTRAADAARRCGDVDGEARMHGQLGRAYIDLEDYESAARELAIARDLGQRSGHRELQASILEWTGVLELARSDAPAAIALLEQAREIFVTLGSERGVALQDYHLGQAFGAAGDHRRAIECLLRAKEHVDTEVDGLTSGRLMLRTGVAYSLLGDVESARRELLEAMELMARHDASLYVAKAREALAGLEEGTGDRKRAAEHLAEAHAIYSTLGSPRAEHVRQRLARYRAGVA
ncbi:MAG: ATP-binding protein [Acidimicrobiales bacterium]